LDTPLTSELQDALQVIKQKMQPEGVWHLDNSLNGKMWIDIEKKGKPSKWITYFALYVFRHFEE
jgi:hypothetical protein